MALLLIAVSGLFAVMVLLNNVIKAVTRVEKVSFWDLTFVFMMALLALAGVIFAADPESSDFVVVTYTQILSLGVMGAGLLIVILEIFRPQRLKASRGLLTLFAGAAMLISTITVPLIAVYTTLAPTIQNAATEVAAASTADPESTVDPTAAAAAQARQRFTQLFVQVIDVVIAEVTVEPDILLTRLEEGTPLSELVVEYGGDLDRVIDGITAVMQNAIRESAERGNMNLGEAALAISQMEFLVRLAVRSDITQLERAMGRPTSVPGAPTEPSFRSLLTGLPPGEAQADTETQAPPQTETPTEIPTDTREPSPTRTATLTRTPRPTETPYPTIQRYASRTPTATATLVTPCLAQVDYNLRVRSTPEQINAPDNTRITIDFGNVIELYGRTEDGLWWFTIYEGVEGWVKGEFMTIGAACDRLPILGD